MRTLLCSALLLSFACGDDGPVDLGLPRDTVLAGLSDAEAMTACENASQFDFQFTQRQECTIAGVVLTDDPTSCETVVEGCLEEEPTPPEEPDCTDASGSDFDGCNVTVGQVEDCLNAQVPISRNYFGRLTCANAGEELSPPIAEGCVDVRTRCPQLFED